MSDPAQDLAPTEQAPMLALIERAAANPDVDMQKMRELLDMQERILAKQAESQFYQALQAAQSEMPSVVKRAENTHTGSRYATLEGLNREVVPVYTRHGFALSFGTEESPLEDHIRIVCDVSHWGGHSKRYFWDAPLDTSGPQGKSNKSRVQASGSSLSYGRRYLTMLIFNVATRDDDDGNGPVETITDDQAANLQALAEEVGADKLKFLKYFKIDKFEELPAEQWQKALNMLEKKRGR